MKLVMLLILILSLVACSAKKGMTTSKIKIFGGNAFSAGGSLATLANNGLILYGTSTDGKSFTQKIDSDTIELTFPNGVWSFYAVAWQIGSPDSTTTFKGKTRCAKQVGVTLNGTDVSVSLSLDNASCADPAFTNSSYNSGSQVYLPQKDFVGCKDQTIVSSYSDTAACARNGIKSNRGYATSFKVYIPQYKKYGTGVEEYKDSFISTCMTISPTNSSATLDTPSQTNLSAMSFPDSINGVGLALRLYYSQTPCDDSTGFDDVNIVNGDTPRTKMFTYTTGQNINRYFYKSVESNVCQGVRASSTSTYAGGVGDTMSPYLICNEAQFNLIGLNFGSGSESQSFELMRDLDFKFANINLIGNPVDGSHADQSTSYTGNLYGNFKKISNVFIRNDLHISSGKKIGLIRKAYSNSVTPQVSNLTLNRFAIVGFEKFTQVGSVVGYADGSSFEGINVFGHIEGSGVVGGLAGELVASAAAPTITRSALEVDINGKIDSANGNNLGVGGVVGHVSGTTSVTIQNVAVKPSIDGSGEEKYFEVDSSLYANAVTGTNYSIIASSTIAHFRVSSKFMMGAAYWIKVDGVNTGNFAGASVYNLSSSSDLGAIVAPIKIAGVGGVVGVNDGTGSMAIKNVLVKSGHIRGAKNIGGIIGQSTSTTSISEVKIQAAIEATPWGAAVTATGVGGVAGKATSSLISQAIVMGKILGDSTDSVSQGAIVGLDSSSSVTNVRYTMNNANSVGGGSTASIPAALNYKANYTGYNFVSYVDSVLPTSSTLVSGATSGDIYLNRSTGLCYIYSAGSWNLNGGSGYCPGWYMHAEAKAVPRLVTEVVLNDSVPFVTSLCKDQTYYQATPILAADGGRIICDPSQIATTTTLSPQDHLGDNLYIADGSVTAELANGVVKLNGHGFDIYNWSNSTGIPMFNILDIGSYISNINIKGWLVSNNSTAGNDFALFARKNKGTIENVNIHSSILSILSSGSLTDADGTSSFRVGALVGKNYGTIRSGELNANILITGSNSTNTILTGGVAGYSTGVIEKLQVHSNINRQASSMMSTAETFGGIAGVAEGTFSQVNLDAQLNFNLNGGSATITAGPMAGLTTAGGVLNINNFDVNVNANTNNVTIANPLNLHVGPGSVNTTKGFYSLSNSSELARLSDVPVLVDGANADVVYMTKSSSVTKDNILYNYNYTVGSFPQVAGYVYNGGSPINMTQLFSGWNYVTSFADSLNSSYLWRIDTSMGNDSLELVNASGNFDRIGVGF